MGTRPEELADLEPADQDLPGDRPALRPNGPGATGSRGAPSRTDLSGSTTNGSSATGIAVDDRGGGSGERLEAPADQPAATGQGWLVPLCVLIVGTFMSVLDTSIVNVAIPKMQIELNAAVDDVEWVVTAYTLALGVVVPLTGWLGDRFGKARLHIASMVGFAVTSGLCGAAWDLGSMVAFRVLQAIPGGVLPVITMTLLYEIVPRSKLGVATGIYGLGVVVAPAVGPTLGGYLVEYVDWRLIFYINVPIAVVGAIAATAVFPRTRPASWPKFDVWGAVTIAYGLFAMLLAFSEAHNWGWTGYRILGLLISSALSLALFVIIELEVESPLIDLRIFQSWPFVVAIALLGIAMTGLFSALFFIPQFLQIVQGMQALDAGLVLVPSALVLVVMMPITGRLYDAIGPRWLSVSGMAIIAYGSYLLAGMTPHTPTLDIAIWTSIRNVGTGLAIMPIITAGVASLPRSLTSAGSGMNNVMQRVSSSIAIAIFGSLASTASAQMRIDWSSLYAGGSQALPEITAAQRDSPAGLLGIYTEMNKAIVTQTYNNGFYAVALLCGVGALVALLLPTGKRGEDPAESVHVEI